jgi:hypothetical protein
VGLALLAGGGTPSGRVLTPVRDAILIIWLFLSARGSRSHRSSRELLLLLPLLVDERSALRILSKQEAGRLISARSDLTFSDQGDLEICVGCHAYFGVIVVLVGFSLETVARIIIPMAE